LRFGRVIDLQHLTERLQVWPFDSVAAEEFGKIQAEQNDNTPFGL
jgi:hypothetical protein